MPLLDMRYEYTILSVRTIAHVVISRCDLDPGRVASWYSPKLKMRMSAFAAQVLAEEGYIKLKKLKLYREPPIHTYTNVLEYNIRYNHAGSREYHPHVGPSDPITGAVPPAIKILNDFGRGVAKLPSEPVRGVAQMLSATTFGPCKASCVRQKPIYFTFVGVQSTLKGASEGLYNVPKLYGSRVREHKEVKGLGSGLAQGTKVRYLDSSIDSGITDCANVQSLVMGTYDGIHDLFAAPVQGYKENVNIYLDFSHVSNHLD